MTDPARFVAELERVAEECSLAENAYRRESAARIRRLAEERVFAFRRLNFLRTVVRAVDGAETADAAVAAAKAALCARLGWPSESQGHAAILAAFAPVAAAMFDGSQQEGGERGGDGEDPATALARFEAWYAETHPTPFWALFEEYVVETPVVDF